MQNVRNRNDQVKTSARLAISLTAHERVEVLANQIRNIGLHCKNPLVIVHLSRDFAVRLREEPSEAHLLGLISCVRPSADARESLRPSMTERGHHDTQLDSK